MCTKMQASTLNKGPRKICGTQVQRGGEQLAALVSILTFQRSIVMHILQPRERQEPIKNSQG